MYNIMLASGVLLIFAFILWNAQHSKSSNHLSQYKVKMLLTIFLLLYISSLWLVSGGLYL